MDRMDDKLDALFAEYRDACPDPEPSAAFSPNLWKRIERQRGTTSVFRRLAQFCVGAAVTATLVMAVVIPELQRAPVYNSSYVDVLADNLPNSYIDILTGDIR